MRLLLATGIILAGLTAAQADEIKFFSGVNESPASAVAFTIAPGTVYQAIHNDPTACAGGGPGNCSGNVDTRAASVNFAGGITATGIAATPGNGVIVDTQPDFGGLGVGPLSGIPSDRDQIQVGDFLRLTFNAPVTLTGVSTLFDTGHTPFGTGFETNATVIGANQFTINGAPFSFLAANAGLLSITGTSFLFGALAGNPQYYISGLEFSAVPIPGAIWLFGSGMLGLFAMSRKKRKAAAQAAA